jgi:hypothetical protein
MTGAWYAPRGGRAAELLTILHPPYTGMVLCYVALGAVFAPKPDAAALAWTLLAYMLGLGIGAHALDQLSGRPWGRALSPVTLRVLAVAGLLGGAGIGVYLSATRSWWILVFVALESFFAVAYNLDRFFRGRFHTDGWFMFSWGALPFISSYFIQTLTLRFAVLALAAVLAGTAGLEITLSRWVKAHRRRTTRLLIEETDGTRREISTRDLIGRPQRALVLVVGTTYLLTASLVAMRLAGIVQP